MIVWRAQITVAPNLGYATVQRQGETLSRSVAILRHLSAAQVGDWVLVVEDSGQCWAIGALGTAPTPAPPNPPPTGGDAGESALAIPVAWSGYREWSPYDGDTAAGFESSTDSAGSFYFGRANGYWANKRSEGMAIYLGMKGLSIASAKVTFWYNGASATDVADANTRLALWKAPETKPADRTSGHPAGISLLATQALGVSFPPSGDVTVQLPAAWIGQLVAGTANGIGLVNNTMPPTTSIFGGYGVVAHPLQITYN